MAVQFSLSYDANGDPILVENTDTGTRKVVSTSPVVSEYKSRFETPKDNIPEEKEDVIDKPISDYIREAEEGAASNDLNLSFIEKKNLAAYTPEAIKARETPLTQMQELVKKGFNLVAPSNIKAGLAILKAVENFLPQESQEIKAIKQFYATPEIASLVEDIPGMSNYNLVYGNPFNPSYGLANAAQRRIDMINKNLLKGIYKDPESMQERKRKLQKLIDKENAAKLEQQYKTSASEEIRERTTNIGDVTREQQRQANKDARAIERAYRNETGDNYSGGESTPGDDTSYSDPFDPGGGE